MNKYEWEQTIRARLTFSFYGLENYRYIKYETNEQNYIKRTRLTTDGINKTNCYYI